MTHTKTTFLQLTLLIAIAFCAGAVSAANPHYDPPGTTIPPANNTPEPVYVSPFAQVKGAGAPPATGGGLSVGSFNALANSAFEQLVFIRGLMLGAPTADPLETNLDVGASSLVAYLVAHLDVGGQLRSTEGLYSQKIVTGAGALTPLCSTTSGNVILCPTPPPPPPPPPNNVIKGRIAYQCLDWYTYHSWPTPIDYHQGEGKLTFYFDAPTPVPLTIRMAVCEDEANPTLLDLCKGVPLIPTVPSGYGVNSWGNNAQNPGWLFTVPQGSSIYNTPMPVFSTADTTGHLACQPRPSNRPRRVNTAEVTRLRYLYLKDESPGNKTFQFTGQSYQPNFTRPVPINITQI